MEPTVLQGEPTGVAVMVTKKTILVGIAVLCAVSVIVMALFAMQVRQTPFVFSAEAPPLLRDKGISFLAAAVGFNMSEYTVAQVQYAPQICVVSPSGLPLIVMSYTLQSEANQVVAECHFTDNNGTYTLESYSQIYMDAPAWVYPPYPPDNLLNWTKGFMERYQNFLGVASHIAAMRNLLDAVDKLEPLNMTSGNIKLQISIHEYNVDEVYTIIKWMCTAEGCDYEDKAVKFEFHNGVYTDFIDVWNVIQIGDEHVNIAQDEAVSIAWENAKSYVQSKYGNATGDSTLLSTPSSVSLIAVGGPAYVPMWRVQFSFDKSFYYKLDGMQVNGVSVMIRANNGEVSFCSPFIYPDVTS